MTVRTGNPDVQRACARLADTGPRGRALADLLAQRRTRIYISRAVVGGFTLNGLNAIWLQPLREGASDIEFDYWMTVLAHEACHIEQGFWVDSIVQEMRAYQTQCTVTAELNLPLGAVGVFADLHPEVPEQRVAARLAMLSLFAGQPAAIVYAALPLMQPVRLGAILPGLRELVAVICAALKART